MPKNKILYTIDIENYKKLLEVNKNLNDASIMKGYMKNHFNFYGVKSEERKRLFKQCLAKASHADETKICVRKLWKEPEREMQYAAMDLLDKSKKTLEINDLKYIEYLVVTKSWWDTVDHIATHYLGSIMSKIEKTQQWEICERWIKTENLWLQRCAILYQLKYKDKTDFEIMKDCIWATLHNDNFFIRKAAGWALREYSKTRKHEVSMFFEEYGDLLSSLTKREGMKYL